MGHNNQWQRDLLRDLESICRWQCSEHHLLKAESITSLLSISFSFRTYLYDHQHDYATHCLHVIMLTPLHQHDWFIFYLLQSVLFLNGLSTFSWVHLILLQHVIILSQGTLYFTYFLMRSLSPLCYHSLLLISMLCMAMLTSLLFHLMPHASHMLCFHSMHCLLNFRTHSPGLRVCLMHTVSVDPIQSCTNIMSSI